MLCLMHPWTWLRVHPLTLPVDLAVWAKGSLSVVHVLFTQEYLFSWDSHTWSLPNLCLSHSCAWLMQTLTLTNDLYFLAWSQTYFIALSLSANMDCWLNFVTITVPALPFLLRYCRTMPFSVWILLLPAFLSPSAHNWFPLRLSLPFLLLVTELLESK